MRNFIIIFTLVLLIQTTGCSPDPQEQKREKIANNIDATLKKYPLITLQDIYKGYFQDYLGPAHIIPDSKTAQLFIEKELQQADTLYGDYYTPCGWQENYYRVNLKIIKDSLISLQNFAKAFTGSAIGVDSSLVEKWRDEWIDTMETISRYSERIKGFSRDSAAIMDMLDKGEYVVHHSPIFNSTYHPHYRIIKREIFEEEILPLLK